MDAGNPNVAICVAGWHFWEDTFRQLARVPRAEVFVVSHRPARVVPRWLLASVKAGHVFFERNLGYDWGCYEQFVEKGICRDFDYVFFMHDDLTIKDIGFVEACVALMRGGYKVIGNGRNSRKLDFLVTHLHAYAHSSWMPPSVSFRHDTVRGSFFGTSREVLEKVRSFEVFWDRFHLHIRFGNWSLLSTCGKLQWLFGEKTFGFLSEDYRRSPFIVEEERGGPNSRTRRKVKKLEREIVKRFDATCRRYMEARLKPRRTSREEVRMALMRRVMGLLAGR